MPSRKRSKGQARKASKALAISRASGGPLTLSAPVEWSNGCSHCCPDPQGECASFITAFRLEWEKRGISGGSLEPLVASYEKYPTLLNDETNVKELLSFFVSIGTEILKESQSYPGWRISAGGLAAAIMIIENHDPSQHMGQTVIDIFQLNKDHMKHVDTAQGCEKLLTKFYSRRTACACLDERYASVKTQPCTGICEGCKKRKKRTELLLCVRCNSFQYCSRQCQALHYPSHREDCKGIAFYTAKNVELTSSGQDCVGQTISQQLKDELNTRYARRAEPRQPC